MYYYDNYGWLTQSLMVGRDTDIAPPAEDGGLRANWSGEKWVLMAYTPPTAPPPAPAVNPTEWLIDVGPFFDRFGAAKMAVLISTDPGVKAILADLQVRKWIDLKRSDVGQGVQYVGSVVPTVTAELQASILNDPVTDFENLALRKVYFA